MFTEIALLILIYMTLVFVLAQIAGDNSIVDIFLGAGFYPDSYLLYDPGYGTLT